MSQEDLGVVVAEAANGRGHCIVTFSEFAAASLAERLAAETDMAELQRAYAELERVRAALERSRKEVRDLKERLG